MFVRKYLVLSVCVVLSLLVVTAPVAAAQSYAVSVSSFGSGPLSSSLSAGKLAALQGQTSFTSPLNSYNGISSQKLSSLNSLQAQGGNAAIGSVSAFSSYSSRTETSSTLLDLRSGCSSAGEFATRFHDALRDHIAHARRRIERLQRVRRELADALDTVSQRLAAEDRHHQCQCLMAAGGSAPRIVKVLAQKGSCQHRPGEVDGPPDLSGLS